MLSAPVCSCGVITSRFVLAQTPELANQEQDNKTDNAFYVVFIEKLIQGVVNYYTYLGTLTILFSVLEKRVETLITRHELPILSIIYLYHCVFFTLRTFFD